ncbi:F-box/LRR-repeat protein At3g58930 [Linum perenne]
MNNYCACQFAKAAKRARGAEEEEGASVDRLSDLPDFILYHILSFLDTKYVVQTSVLSRFWRYVWKHVPVLNFHRDTFRDGQSFVRFVNKVLALHDQLGIHKISFVDDELASWKPSYKKMFGRVMEYASSHGTQHLVISLQEDCTFDDYCSSILISNLKTLELRCVDFPCGFGSSSFQMLTTLNLERCYLHNDQEGVFDLISNFPSLMNLVVSRCRWIHNEGITGVFSTKIIGMQLLSLKLDRIVNAEIVAPRLKFFYIKFFAGFAANFQGFSKLSIPSIVHAEILVLESYLSYFGNDKERMEYCLDNLFQGLHNAESLMIRSNDDQV